MRVFSIHSENRQTFLTGKVASLLLSSSVLLFSFQQSLNAQDTYLGPSILPPAPNAIDGGNPFQGLGRSDDPGPSREKQFGFPTYNTSSFNANGMQDSPPPVINSDGYANYRNTNSTNSGNGGGPGSSGSASGTSGQSGNGAPNSFPAGFIPTSMLDSPPIVPPSNAQAPAPPFREQLNAVPTLPSGFAGQAGFGNVLPSDSQNANGNSIRNINMESNFVNNVNTATPTQTPVPPDSQQGSGVSGMSNFGIASPQQNASMSIPQKSQPARSDQSDTGSKNSFFDRSASIFDKDMFPGTPDSSGTSDALKPSGSAISGGTNSGSGSGSGSSNGSGGPNGSGGESSSGSGVRNSSSSLRAGAPGAAIWLKSTGDKAFKNSDNLSSSTLVPPPPATPLSSSINGPPGGRASSPLEKAVEQIKLGRLPDALATINDVLRTDSGNANAHYLKAVVSVLSRRFTDARAEYLATLKYSHSAELSDRARVGLTKLTR